jgi:hypothetical protein
MDSGFRRNDLRKNQIGFFTPPPSREKKFLLAESIADGGKVLKSGKEEACRVTRPGPGAFKESRSFARKEP